MTTDTDRAFRVVVIDDHALVRERLTALINAQRGLVVVGEAADGRRGRSLAASLQPDVVLLDLSVDRPDDIDSAAWIAREHRQVKVLALVDQSDPESLMRLMQTGAAGFVLKRVAADELITALRAAAANGSYVDPVLGGKVLQTFVRRPEAAPARDDPAGGLSERERSVGRMLAWGYGNKEIAVKLGLSTKTVETYKARVTRKLRLRSRADLVRHARDVGWLAEPMP